jgi:hypothetical protein
MVAAQLGGVVVALAGEPARGFLDLAVPGPGIEDRRERVGDAALVHVVERHLRRPGRAAFAAIALDVHVALRRRNDVVMDVDPVRLPCRLRRRCAEPGRSKAAYAKPGGGAALEEAAPAYTGGCKARGRLATQAAAQKGPALESLRHERLSLACFLTAAMVDAGSAAVKPSAAK